MTSVTLILSNTHISTTIKLTSFVLELPLTVSRSLDVFFSTGFKFKDAAKTSDLFNLEKLTICIIQGNLYLFDIFRQLTKFFDFLKVFVRQL